MKEGINMKKMITFLFFLLVMVPSVALAHTGLLESNPTEGQIVTDEVKEIELTFKGHIQTLSKMVLDQDRKEIEWAELKKEEVPKISNDEDQPSNFKAISWIVLGVIFVGFILTLFMKGRKKDGNY